MTTVHPEHDSFMVRPLDKEQPEPSVQLVRLLHREPFVQCGYRTQGSVIGTHHFSYRQRRCEESWKAKSADFIAENCARQALYTVGGLAVCSRHAGLILLDACLEMGI